MSYDLFVKPIKGSFSDVAFREYFSARKHYSLEGCQAWYQNEDTGVYFLFELQDQDDVEDGEEYYPVAFNMNYFRPSYFVYEAEPEVRAFINEFSMLVDDPQTQGMGTGKYNSEDFFTGWLHGNEFGYSAVLKDQPDVCTLPQQQLRDAWQWNFNKQALQDTVTDDVFVPGIMLLNYNGTPVTAAVWPDAIPSVIPKVDILLIGRKELAPRRLFKKAEDMAIGSWAVFQSILERHKTKMHDNAYYLYYESVPQEFKMAVKALSPSADGDLEGLGSDQVLDREIVQKYVA